MKSVWNSDDCWTWAFGDIKRPRWMAECKTAEEAADEAEHRYTTIENVWRHYLVEHGYGKIEDYEARPGDRAIVSWRPKPRPDIRHSMVAVMEPNCQWVIRTLRGHMAVNPDRIISYWTRRRTV